MRLLRDEDRRTDGGVLVDMAEATTVGPAADNDRRIGFFGGRTITENDAIAQRPMS